MQTLIVDGTGRHEQDSKTKYLANRVIEKLNLHDYQTVDLYNTELPFVTKDIIKSWSTLENDTIALQLLNQFEQSDQIIFIYPTWNWSVPAIVRAYMDLIIISGRTFKYNSQGKSYGCLTDKRVILISTTGGKTYPRVIASILKAQSGDNYMKQVLGTIGITDIVQYGIDNTAYNFNDSSGSFDVKQYQKYVKQFVDKIT
ncbi:NAD(P)H-dependent oxidoreductase [Mollicutes bacterium LVI A0039]|nr:NAD(P)H-dependent oxidoreductase [Mollicutes bacterium LVI A0039]